jgi:hypothetical protein
MVVIVLCLVLDGLLAMAERVLRPRHLGVGRSRPPAAADALPDVSRS